MTPIEQASRYLAKCPAAVSGDAGHNVTFKTVCTVVNGFALGEDEAMHALHSWNLGCDPPWKEHELRHKIRDAMRTIHDKPRGHKLRNNGTTYSQGEQMPQVYQFSKKIEPEIKLKPVKYDIKADDIPEPIQDGCRELITKLFKPGEGIRIAPAHLNAEGKEIPDGGGCCFTREEWLRRLNERDGDPNRIFSSSDRCGIYIAINPYKPGATRDADVTDLRHALIEFDEQLSQEEQLNLYLQMKLPCAAVIDSGGKSVHAWVKIDARDRNEYDERVRILYAHFLAAGLKLDEKNKNPGRLSRLPHCIRFERRQELLFLNVGLPSFSDWLAEIQADELGERHDIDDLAKIDMSDMSNVLIGNDWINKGGSCIISGPSGVGKSTLTVQMAVHFAVHQALYGIQSTRPLKSVIIQAENDERDNKRILFGILAKLEIDPEFTPDLWAKVKANVVFRTNFSSGESFIKVAQRIADKEKPDLMWLDPAAAFVGDDISKQIVIAQFFRTGLHPIAKNRGFAWMVINHFTKPPTEQGQWKGRSASDYQYRGAGSYDLTGWARAGIVLSEHSTGVFNLRFAKRGKLSGASEPNGTPTDLIWLRHASEGIYWEQIEAPSEDGTSDNQETDFSGSDDAPREEKLTKPEQVNRAIDIAFCNSIPAEGEGLRPLIKRLTNWMAESASTKMILSKGTAERAVELMLKAGKVESRSGVYFKGKNA